MFSRSSILQYTIIIVVFLVAISLSGLNYTLYYLTKPSDLDQEKIILFKDGTSTKAIVSTLTQEGIIENPRFFNIIVYFVKMRYSLKAGEYSFTKHITPAQVIDIFIRGKNVIHRLVIPEGLTNQQIIERVNNERLLLGSIANGYREGWLMPDTYYYSYGDKKQLILDQMHYKMKQLVDDAWQRRSVSSEIIQNKEQALTMASIIEKETRLDSERRRVSGVFYNRLKKNMKLQADPTVIYAVSNGYGDIGRPLSKADLRMLSPYNTYVSYGLPPHPICNPGKDAVIAALNPAVTKDLYFVVNGNGGHNFSPTLTGHNDNVRGYRKKVEKSSKVSANTKR